MAICEIRILTYKRPQWLRRAIQSALAQDHSDVRILILEDSPGQEGREVAASFNDPRIIYRPNPKNLGCAANTALGFSRGPMAEGEYFCVLDDDNWLYPTFVSENIRCLESSGLGVCLRNQEIWDQGDEKATQTTATTRGQWFTEGRVEPIDVYSRLFFSEGISHGGLFWSKNAKTDFFIGPEVNDAGLAECCRTLQVVEPIYFCAKPLAAFSLMSESLRIRSLASNREFGRGRQAIARFLISMHGKRIIDIASNVAAQAGAVDQFRLAMLDAVHPFAVPTSLDLATVGKTAKSIAKLLLVKNPLRIYLRDLSRQPWRHCR